MRRLLTLILLSVLAAPLAARADGSIAVSASAGVTKPFGDVANGQKLDKSIDWAFPLEAQLGFRLLKQLSLGGYVRFAPTSLPSGCTGCTVTDLAFGGRVEYRFSERLEGGGWIGAFAGYEQMKSEVKADPALNAPKFSRTLSGLEGGLAAGADFELGGLTMGPWVQAWMGQFSKQSGDGVSSTIASKGIHGFYGAGIRLTLLL